MTFTNEQKALMNNERAVKTMRIEFTNPNINTIDANHIYQESLEIDESLFDGELHFGKCNATMFKTKVADFGVDIIGEEIEPYVLYTHDQDSVDVPFGKYIIQSAERTSDRRWLMITAIDKMSLFDVDIADWYNYVLYAESWDVPSTVKYQGDTSPIEEITYPASGDNPIYPGITIGDEYADLNVGKVYTLEDELKRYSQDPVTGEYTVTWYATWTFAYDLTKTATNRTVKEIRDMLCTYIGVTQETVTLPLDNLSVPKTINPDTLSARDLLQSVCEINGCFGHFDWEGILQYAFLQDDGLLPSEGLYPSNDLFPRNGQPTTVPEEFISVYKNCDFADYDTHAIDSVAIMNEDGSLAVHYEESQNYTNRYNISGNILLYGFDTSQLEGIAEVILEQICDAVYRPNTVETFGCAYMQLGQDYVINTRIINGSEIIEKRFESFLTKRSIHGIQGMFSTVQAEGTEYLPKIQTNDVASEMKILKGKSAKYERDLEHLSIEFSDYEEETTAAIEVNAHNITLKVGKDEVISSINQTSEQITIQASKISLEGIVTANQHFKILSDGSMECNDATLKGNFRVKNASDQDVIYLDNNGNAVFEGRINATSGIIGGWRLLDNSLYCDSGNRQAYIANPDSSRPFFIFCNESNNTTFNVDYSGDVYARGDLYIGGTSSFNGNVGMNGTLTVFSTITAQQFIGDLQGTATYAGTATHLTNGSYYIEINSDGHVAPVTNDFMDIGTTSRKFQDLRLSGHIYCPDATIHTSDRNLKKDITDISTKYEDMFMNLRPVSYKFKTGKRTHIGFISQEVEDSMKRENITAMDFAGFCMDANKELVTDDEGNETEQVVKDDKGNIEYTYGLRYGEFIALNTHMIQKLYKRIEDLENTIKELTK